MKNSMATLRRMVFVIAFFIPSYGMAAECGKYERIIGFLAQKYGEYPVGEGTIGGKGIMQIFVSKKGTWTVLVTDTRGVSCIATAGEGFSRLPPHKAKHTPS